MKLCLQSELDRLCALNLQRQEDREQLAEERAQFKRERERTDAWILGLKGRHEYERHFLEEKICSLESEQSDLKLAEWPGPTDGDHDDTVGGTAGVGGSSPRDSTWGDGHRLLKMR